MGEARVGAGFEMFSRWSAPVEAKVPSEFPNFDLFEPPPSRFAGMHVKGDGLENYQGRRRVKEGINYL